MQPPTLTRTWSAIVAVDASACSIAVQNGFDEQPIVRRSASHMAFSAWQKILDPVPLVVA
jgi:hypothetical protein